MNPKETILILSRADNTARRLPEGCGGKVYSEILPVTFLLHVSGIKTRQESSCRSSCSSKRRRRTMISPDIFDMDVPVLIIFP